MKINRIFSLPVVMAFFVWIGGLSLGTHLSQYRKLWNDEIYSQTYSIEPLSYKKILLGHVPEGNNCPMFYVLQKALCDITQYRFPGPWSGQWYVYEPESQIVLRIVSNIFMSTSIALIFYFFVRFYSIHCGLFALLATFATPMVWLYWVEARPYGLLFLLTTLQSLIFMLIMRGKKNFDKEWLWLALTHIALSLTISLGVIQFLITSTLLWIFKERRPYRYLFMTVIPLILSVAYYVRSPKYQFRFRESPWELMVENVPREYFVILLAYLAVACYFMIFARGKKGPTMDVGSVQYFLFSGLMFLGASCVLCLLNWKADDVSDSFAVSSRYFIFLVPVSIIAGTIGVRELWRVFKDDVWMRANVAIAILGLMMLSACKTQIAVLNSGIFMHFIR